MNQLKRFYEYVPPQNVLVVTADQAFSSGMATLAVVLIEWRMLGLPLVDPVSVTSDLMFAAAAASTGAGLSGLENSGLEHRDGASRTATRRGCRCRVRRTWCTRAPFAPTRTGAAAATAA